MNHPAGVLAALLALGLAAAPVASSSAAPVTHASARAYAVTLKVDDPAPTVGDRIRLSGRVSPAAPGSKVVLQVRYDNRKSWKTLDRARLHHSGGFRFVERIKTDRTRLYRVVEAADARHGGSRSPKVKVVAYDWVPLDSLGTLNDSGWLVSTPVSLNGTPYPASFAAYTGSSHGTVDVNLAHRCRLLDTTIGLGDSSTTGSSATVGITLDGTPLVAQPFGLTQSQHVEADVTDAFRVTLSYTQTAGAQAVIGSPQALCRD